MLRLPLAWAIVLIACQAFLAAERGLRFGQASASTRESLLFLAQRIG